MNLFAFTLEKAVPKQNKGVLADVFCCLIDFGNATGRKEETARWTKELEVIRAAKVPHTAERRLQGCMSVGFSPVPQQDKRPSRRHDGPHCRRRQKGARCPL